MEALDEVHREVWREAHAEAVQAAKAHPRGKGRPKADDHDAKIVAAARAKAEAIKNSAFALGKAPEHLTENQQTRIAMIAENNSRLYRAYRMKETLRLLLKIKDVKEAEVELDRWLWWASHSRIPAFKELYKKIKRHKGYIEHHTARHEQRKDRSYQQQDQADYQEGIWLSQHPEHAGYGLSSLL